MTMAALREYSAMVGLVGWMTATVALAETPRPFSPPPPSDVTAFRHATLIDTRSGKTSPGMTVVVTGETISDVEPDAAFDKAPIKARIVDLTGSWIMPGLIDSHVHLATPPDRVEAEMILRRDLFGGVTNVRDMADDLRAVGDLARAARIGEIPGPDIDYAALMAGPDFFSDPRTWAVSHGATPGATPWMQAITPLTDMPLAVALARGTSATAIKIYANLDGQAVARITSEAHRQHLKVWAHAAVFPAAPEQVIAAGVDGISHVCYLAYQVSDRVPDSYQHRVPVAFDRLAKDDNPVMQRLFDRLHSRGVVLDATLRVYLEDDRRALAHPGGRPQLCTGDLAARLINQAWRAGVAISTGTDGVATAEQQWPEVHDEMFGLVEQAHLPISEVLRAATVTGARALGREDVLGVIAPGFLANMIIMSRNPLEDIHNIRSISTIVKRGHEFRRSEFRPEGNR